MGASQDAVDKFAEDLLGNNDIPGLRQATLQAMHTTLTNRTSLDSMTKVAVKSLNGLLDSSKTVTEDWQNIELFPWVRRVITLASTDATYGIKHNPFRDDEVRNGFWAFDDDFARLGINIFPSVLAPNGARGRAILEEAMREYYRKDGQLSASEMVRARLEVNQGFDICSDDIARFDVGVCHGLLANIVPAAYWIMYYVFSNSILLNAIKLAVSDAMYHDIEGGKLTGCVQVDIAAIMARCPIIPSLVRETLRMQSTNAAFRIVLQDTMIDGQYLLQKDALLFIPSADIHHSETVWGSTAKVFDPTRFLDQHKGKTAGRFSVSAYRAWGCGAAVCPGRYFATNEIIAFLVMMVLKYDVCSTAGMWPVPQREPHIGAAIVSPADKIEVTLKEREDVKGMTFDFSWNSPER